MSIEILSLDEISSLEKIESNINVDEKVLTNSIEVPSINDLSKSMQYEFIEGSPSRLKDRQAAPEYIMLCKNIIQDRIYLFFYHGKNRHSMNTEDVLNYKKQFKLNHNAKELPEKLDNIFNFFLTYEEKRQLENAIETPENNAKKLKV